MLVRTKISFLTVFILGALGALSLFAARWFVLGSFDRLEKESAADQALRAAALVRKSAESLASTLGDWAAWDDSYAFAGGELPGYPSENFMDETLMNLDVSLVAFLGADSSVVYAKAVNLADGIEEPVPQNLLRALGDGALGLSGNQRTNGLVVIGNRPWIFAVSPVLPTGGKGTPRGLMAMARSLDNRFMENLSEILGLPVSVQPEQGSSITGSAHSAAGEPPFSGPGDPIRATSEALDRRTMAGYAKMEGFGGSPGALIRVVIPRTIRSVGIRSYLYFAAALGLLVAAAALSQLVLFERLVVRRIVQLGRDLDLLDALEDSAARMTISGTDEISRFASTLNETLDKLDATRSRLEQARRGEAIAELAGGMAHEFNNILAIVLGALESAAAPGRTEEERVRLLQTARAASLRGRDIVDQVLLHVRTARADRRYADLPPILDKALDQVAVLAKAGIEFKRRYAPVPRIPVNEGLVTMLVVNVAKNALEAIGAGPGTVSIALDLEEIEPGHAGEKGPPPGRYARLTIEDSGRGMEPHELAHAFDPFFTTKAPGKGSGLGLAVVKGVMRQHDGFIDVSSESGKGTRFTFRFPCGPSDRHGAVDTYGTPGGDPSPGPEASPSANATFPLGRLLLVGTDRSLVLAEQGLGMLGYAVHRVDDDSAALARLDWGVDTVDLVIADEGIGEAGLDALVRAAQGPGRFRLLVCAAPGSGVLPGSGIHAVLAKPAPIRSLIAAVDEALPAR